MTQLRSRTVRLAAASLATATALTLAACGGDAGGDEDGGLSAATGSEPVEGRPMPVDNPDSTEVKVAMIAFPPELAEFFVAIEAGAQRADAVLDGQGGTVDYIAVTQTTPDAVNEAIRTAIAQEYDAIGTFALGPANCAAIQEATDAGIQVGAIIATADCVQDSGALFFHGENSFDAWRDNVAPAMVEATGGEECQVGIITGQFSVPQHELRRTGFLAGLEGTNLTAVSDGVEANLDPAKFQAAARDYANAYPDLCGIVVTVNDNGAAAEALTPEQAERISVISADLTTGIEQQIESGNQYAGFTQDPFGETYDSAIWLYNAVLTGEAPEGGYDQPVTGTLVTADNLEDAVRAQDQGE